MIKYMLRPHPSIHTSDTCLRGHWCSSFQSSLFQHSLHVQFHISQIVFMTTSNKSLSSFSCSFWFQLLPISFPCSSLSLSRLFFMRAPDGTGRTFVVKAISPISPFYNRMIIVGVTLRVAALLLYRDKTGNSKNSERVH